MGEDQINSTQAKMLVTKLYRKEVFLLVMTIFVLIFLGEVFFRIYYLVEGKTIAADQNELCLKNMKIANNYVSDS